MSFGTWFGKLLGLILVCSIDIALAFAGLYWLHLSEFWVMFLLVSVNTSMIIAKD